MKKTKVIIPPAFRLGEMPWGNFDLPEGEYLASVHVNLCREGEGNLRDSELEERINKTLEFEFGGVWSQRKYGIPLNHDVEILSYKEVGKREKHFFRDGIETGLYLEVHYKFRASEEQE